MENILHQKRKEYCELIREYSRSQCSLWQKLPYLSLCSYGTTGYHDGAMTFFETGYYKISVRVGPNDYTHAYIDCETGEIYDKHYVRYYEISNESLVKIPPEYFDANIYLKNAQYWIDHSKNKLADEGAWVDHDLELPTCNDAEKYFRWKIAKDFNITPVYKRVKK